MSAQSFSYSSRNIGSIDCDPTQVKGRGMALAPRLLVPLTLEMMALESTAQADVGIMFGSVTGFLVVDLAGGFPLNVDAYALQRIIMKGSTKQNVELEFPISLFQMEAIEKARNHGEVSLSLQLKVSYTVLSQGTEAKVGFIPLRAVLDAGVAPVYLHVKVPQSIWTTQVLPAIGFGQVLLLELPAFPVSALASLGEAFAAAKRAQAMFDAGEYDLAVGLCRTAVQPLRNHLKKIKAEVGNDTAADWAEKIGDATFEWLTIVTGKTHGIGSVAAHEGSAGRFTRLDAQMILTTTVAVLAYAARLERATQP